MPAPLNLMKLCVGCPHPEDLEGWQATRFGNRPAEHVTRMWPTREAELLAGGSIYWVFKGLMLARQRLIGLEERRGDEEVSMAFVADRLRAFVDAHPEHAGAADRFAVFLARDDVD